LRSVLDIKGEPEMKEEYLGDGLYASFDGWQVKLRAPREHGDHEVFLQPSVLRAFERFVAQLRSETGNEDKVT
jgi:hypothetical protein